MVKLAPTQLEELQNIGAYLRQVRQQQGLTLDVLANQIFIRPALLQALETGQGAELPEPVFIQGFIRRYAEALGLDGLAISKEFRVTPVEVILTASLLTKADTNGATEGSESTPPRGLRMRDPAPPLPRASSSRPSPLPLVLSLAALAAILGLGAWGIFGRNQGSDPSPNRPNPVATTPPAPVAPETPETPEPEASPSPALEAPVVVSATLSDRAWLSVKADGESVYEGVAEKGFKKTWTAQTSVVLTTGNAGGVELAVNGDRPVAVGSNGAVRTLTLTPDSDVKTVESAESP
ncbi:MAG: helix-turn-helix domain-containing protein [Nodosilinea sp.]